MNVQNNNQHDNSIPNKKIKVENGKCAFKYIQESSLKIHYEDE